MSQCLYRQFEGRVCRTCGDSIQVKIDGEMHTFPAVPKRFARIISHSGNWQPQPKGHGFLRDHYGFSLQNGKKSKGGTASLGSVRYCPGCLSVWPGSRTHCVCGAALSEPKAPPEDTAEELVVVPVGAMPQASHRSVSYLANLWTWWSRNNEKRAALGKPPTKEGQVRHVYHSRAGRWPTDAELAEARAQAKV